MARTVIHVAQQAIAKNRKQGTNDPAIIVNRGGKATRHHEVDLVLPDGTVVGTFVYQPHDPLSCGARLWLEVNNDTIEVRPRS